MIQNNLFKIIPFQRIAILKKDIRKFIAFILGSKFCNEAFAHKAGCDLHFNVQLNRLRNNDYKSKNRTIIYRYILNQVSAFNNDQQKQYYIFFWRPETKTKNGAKLKSQTSRV